MTATTARVERYFDATPQRVWGALTDPVELATWFCPNPALTLIVHADVRVGGKYRVDMGGSYAAHGSYTEVSAPDVLEFTWEWEHEPDQPPSTVRIELTSAGAGTSLMLTHRGLADADDASGHAEGWSLQLDRLEATLTS